MERFRLAAFRESDVGRGRDVVVVDRSREVVRDREDRRTCWNGSRGGILFWREGSSRVGSYIPKSLGGG